MADVGRPGRQPPGRGVRRTLPDVRKTVTILFCDVVDSTVLGEQNDPETRQAMSRYFKEMQAIVEGHGGVVERFRGDEVMAVFGVPSCTRTMRCGRCARGWRCCAVWSS